jgi:histidinol dehydrogenase
MTLQAAPARLSTADPEFEARFKALQHWSADTDAAIEHRVADILSDVQKRGDAAVLERDDPAGMRRKAMAQLLDIAFAGR